MGCFVCQRPFSCLIQGMYETEKNYSQKKSQTARLPVDISPSITDFHSDPIPSRTKGAITKTNTDTGSSYKNMLMGGHKAFIVF